MLVSGHELMATASRDRLVHVFDANNDYQFLQTLDEHSSAITSVKFACESYHSVCVYVHTVHSELRWLIFGG